MQFYKKTPESNNNNEYLKMTSIIKSDLINNVCFECGTKNPQYISINNAVFICKDCIPNHLSFSHAISQIIINDLYSLNLTEIKTLYFGGNRKLIQFINLDFPGLKQLPPEVLYKTVAVDYYRQNLTFLVRGGKKPLRPNNQMAYKLIELKDKYMNNIIGRNDKYFTNTELAPILEGKDELDEKENSEEENSTIKINQNYNENTKNESTMVNTPQKTVNGNNMSDIDNIINKYTNNNINNNIGKNIETKNNLNINEEVKFNTDKNISEIINNEENNNNSNINNKISDINSNGINNINDDISGDDNTIKIVNGFINISRENDFSDFKSNKENNDSSNSLIKEKIDERDNQINLKEKENKNNEDKNEIIVIHVNKNKKGDNNVKKIKKNYCDNEKSNEDIRLSNKIIKEKEDGKNNLDKKNKKDNNRLSDNEDSDDDNINYDDIKIIKKKQNEDRTIKNTKKENKSSKNIIIKKKKDYSIEEEEEESEEESELKSAKIKYSIYPKKEKIEKLNLTEIKPNKHLKAKISSSRIFNINNNIKEKYKYNTDKNIKTKKIINKTEKRDKYMTYKESITKKDKKDKDDFFTNKPSFSSGFINPLKYLQKSFQKKQNEKFENSNSNTSGEDSYEEDGVNDKEEKSRKIKKSKVYEITQRKKYNTYIDKKSEDNISDSNSDNDDEEVD